MNNNFSLVEKKKKMENLSDEDLVEKLLSMGFTREKIEKAMSEHKVEDVTKFLILDSRIKTSKEEKITEVDFKEEEIEEEEEKTKEEEYLVGMGFSLKNVREALRINQTTEEALNWLLSLNDKKSSSFIIFNSNEEENINEKEEEEEEIIIQEEEQISFGTISTRKKRKKKKIDQMEKERKKLKELSFTDSEIDYILSFKKITKIEEKISNLLTLREEIPKLGISNEIIDLFFKKQNFKTKLESKNVLKHFQDEIFVFNNEMIKKGLDVSEFWKIDPSIPIPKESIESYPIKLDQIPRDALGIILLYTDKETCLNVSLVNSNFDVARSNLLWRNFQPEFVSFQESKAYLLPESEKANLLISLEYSIDQFGVKELFASKKKTNQLRDRRLKFEKKENDEKIKWQVSPKRYAFWGLYLLLISICFSISLIYLPLNLDFFNTSYFWLIGYVPLLICSLIHFPWMLYDGYNCGFYPFPRLECGGVTNQPIFEPIIYYVSLFNSIPILVIISGLILFIPGLKELNLWTLFLSPVILFALWDVFSFFIVGIRILLSLNSNKDLEEDWMKATLNIGFAVIMVIVISIFFCYSLSIVFFGLKLDGHLPSFYWSFIFILPEITGFLLFGLLLSFIFTTIVYFLLVAMEHVKETVIGEIFSSHANGFCCGELLVPQAIFISITSTVIMFILYTSSLVTMILLGLVLDKVFSSPLILVTAVAFFGSLIALTSTVLTCIIVLILVIGCGIVCVSGGMMLSFLLYNNIT